MNSRKGNQDTIPGPGEVVQGLKHVDVLDIWHHMISQAFAGIVLENPEHCRA